MPAPLPCPEPRYPEVFGRDGEFWWTSPITGEEYLATLDRDEVLHVSRHTTLIGAWEWVGHYPTTDVDTVAREIEGELRAVAEEQSEMMEAAE